MAESTKKSAARTAKTAVKPTNKKTNFPIWIIVLGLLLGGGYLLMQKMGGAGMPKSGGAGNFKVLEGEVDANDTDQWSYASGYAIATEIARNIEALPENQKLNNEVLAQAFTDVITGGEAKLTEEQVQEIYKKKQEAAQADFQGAAAENAAVGAEYLETYKNESGVEVTSTGVAYKVLESGDASGEQVEKNIAMVEYTGKFPDGTVFDSSDNNGGEPLPFQSSGLIPGMGVVLETMRAGDKYEIVVPGDQAYGENGQGPIGPNQTLIFELEVKEIKFAQEAPDQEASAATDAEEVESDS